MSVSALSSRNPLPPTLRPFNDSATPLDEECLLTRPSSIMFSTYTISKVVLVLPVCAFIFCYCFRRWMKSRCSSSSKPMRHCDFFTYHLVAMEMIGLAGCVLCTLGIFGHSGVFHVGYDFMFYTWFGQTYIHVLTCVDRYLAIVHPVVYRSLRSEWGVGVRGVTGAFLWLLSAGGLMLHPVLNIIYVTLAAVVAAFTAVSFCSLSVLRVLIRPGPGEGQRVHQSKKAAFYTILVVLNVLAVKFLWTIIWSVLKISGSDNCVIMTTECFFNLPGSLLVPLMFLHRKWKKSRRRGFNWKSHGV